MIVKKRLIYFLIALVVLLLVVNLILDKFNPPKVQIKHSEVSQNLIEKKFKKTLSEYGIKNDWIKKINPSKKKDKSLLYLYRVSLPNDISVPLLISDLKKTLEIYDVNVNAEEKNNFGSSVVTIVNNGKIKLKAEFKYKAGIKRSSSRIAFILSNINSLSNEDFNSLLKIPYNYGVIILPDADTESLAKQIESNKKEYYLILNDNISDERFELNNDFTKGVVNRALSNIFKFYKGGSFFLIDNESDLYNSAVIEYIKTVLKRNGKKYFYFQDFTKLHGESKKDLESLWDFYIMNIKPQETKIFVISAADFLSITDKIANYIRKGNKVSLASKILIKKIEN